MAGKIKVGLIGYGYWGPNLARIISKSQRAALRYIADVNKQVFTTVSKNYPETNVITDYKVILSDKQITAVCIVTPTSTHYTIAKNCIQAGKHVFIEKPLTNNVKDSEELVALAEKHKVILMVGHVFLYNPAVRFIKELILKGEIGKVRHLHFQRRSLGPIRKDVDVVWDLSPHDISMLLYFLDEKPVSLVASGISFLQQGVNDVVSVSLKFPGNIMANLIMSWIDPVKIRDITIVGDKKMILFDDVKQFGKVKVFDKNATIIEKTKEVSFGDYQIAIHEGDIQIPDIEEKEPLREELEHFIDCINKNAKPLTDGVGGLEVVKIITAISESLANNSHTMTL